MAGKKCLDGGGDTFFFHKVIKGKNIKNILYMQKKKTTNQKKEILSLDKTIPWTNDVWYINSRGLIASQK